MPLYLELVAAWAWAQELVPEEDTDAWGQPQQSLFSALYPKSVLAGVTAHQLSL